MAKDKNKKGSGGNGKDNNKGQLALGGETPKEKIKPILIEEEMRSSYIEYAMSVIVGRALPDARDGLKPVHRRILYSMYDQGMDATKPYKKSARVVGDVLGKYHPHGDLAIYESLVRMAQDFSLRYPLVDGQGNFGSIDGDGAAAMRYTEARMSKIASELLADLDKETVNFTPNFDESTSEPSVLPTKLPNLLLNGSSGIAVGMATNIPPHNLKEICLAVEALVEDPETSVKKLMKFVLGPDFPTGGIIRGAEGIKSAYETGKGSITVTGKFSVEPAYKKKDRMSIVITEIPYMINKSNMIEKIAELVREKKIEGISDLRDESGREGMRIYIELKKEANAQIVIKQLLKYTTLQSNFSVNLLAIVDGEPKVCNLKDLLEEFIKHRFEVITRRTKYELRKAEERAHILEGLLIALANLDAVIKLIRGSKAPEDAKAGLIKNFKLSEIQAQAILDMRLQRLTQLESLKVKTEHKELMEKIKDYKDILAKKSRVFSIISSETKEIREKYGDDRRTEIQGAIQEVAVEDLIPKDEVAVFITMQGFVKRLPIKTFRNQMRGGKGVVGMATREEDVIEKIYVTSTHSYLMCFTNFGKAYSFKVYDIPDASRVSKGQSIENFLELSAGEQVTTAIPVENLESKDFLVMATKRGI
jgi:DNA gyrase subunit A